MRKIISLSTILFFAFTTFAFAGNKEREDILGDDGVYEEVVQMPDIIQAELFKRAKTWILENMMTSDNNIMFDDKEYTINNNGSLKLDPKTSLMWAIKAGSANFKLHVWLKDGRYKFRVDNLSANIILHANDVVAPKMFLYSELADSRQGTNLYRQINEKMAAFVLAFKKGMNETASEKNDW